jgi:hypothetical protein
MKPIHILALIGGAAAIYYYTTQRGSGAGSITPMPKPKPGGGFYIPQLDTSGGLSQTIVPPPSTPPPTVRFQIPQLQGYFSTGAAPCCSNCAHGRPCSG